MIDLLVTFLAMAAIALVAAACAAALAALSLLRYGSGASNDAGGSCS